MFEYEVIFFAQCDGDSPELLNAELCKLGRQGWRVKAVTESQSDEWTHYTIFLERPTSA